MKSLALGSVGLVRLGPTLALALVGGVAADAFDRRRLLLVTQCALTIQAALLAVWTWHGLTSLWPLYLMVAIDAAIGAFDYPARSVMLAELVPRQDIVSAVNLTSIATRTAAVMGPALAGILIAAGGLGWTYACNATSFLAVIAAVARVPDLPGRSREVRWDSRELGLGLRFVLRHPLLRPAMLLDFFATILGSASALLPVFAQDIFHSGAHAYGWLRSASAIGSWVASFAMLRWSERISRRGLQLSICVVLYGAATVVFGLSTSFWLAFFGLIGAGAADTVSSLLRSTLRQEETPDEMRGRTASINMILFNAGPQLGQLESGMVAAAFGVPFSVASGGIGAIGIGLWVLVSSRALRDYRRGASNAVAMEAVR
jgi:MFS family permease